MGPLDVIRRRGEADAAVDRTINNVDRKDAVALRYRPLLVWTPLGYAASLAVILLGYYELHAVLFGTTLT